MTVKQVTIDSSLDTILLKVGDFGKYQIYVFSLVCVAMVMHSMMHIAYVFTAMDLKYRCKIPDCDTPSNTSFSQPWLENAIPFTNGRPDKCSMYRTFQNDTNPHYENCTIGNFNEYIVDSCDSFVYESKEHTIVKEFNLQCDDNLWKLGMVGTVNNIGQFFGLIISGFVSDRYGRRFLLVWGIILCSVCGCIRAFMTTYELFLVFEFLDAAFGAGSYICGFLLGIELVGPNKRVFIGTLLSSCYVVGEIFVAWAAWGVMHWRPLILICYAPSFACILYLWLIPESIRWNLSKGRVDEAKKTLRQLAKVNGKEITEKELETLDSVSSGCTDSTECSKTSTSLVMEALKSSTLMLRLVACCFCWITCTFLFYGLTINSVALVAGNIYIDFILTALIEVPAYFACIFVVDSLGRKKSLCLSYLLTGAACLSFVFISLTSRWGSLTVYLAGKFGATAAFTILYVLTSEMFPTNLRHSFMGTCSTFGRFGSMISPQTPLLAKIWEPLPLVSFAVMSLLAGILTLVFPETRNRKLPDTIREAEDIGKEPVIITTSQHMINSLEKY